MAQPESARKINQEVPDQFASRLREMRANRDSLQLDATLAAACAAGWTRTALGRAMGISHEAVRVRVGKAEVGVQIGPIPEPPTRPTRRQPRCRRLTADEIAELQQMHRVATRVGGFMPEGHPARRISERYSARLAALNASGVMIVDLARATGVTARAIQSRLERHGYRPRRKLRPDQVYRNKRARRLT